MLGIAGVEGNGQAELVETVMGMRDADVAARSGSATPTSPSWDTRRIREAGIGYIPEDRHRHGLLLDSPLWENRILGHQTRPPSARGPWIDRGGARADTQRIVEQYDVRTPGIDTPARALSGGNQQKLIVGREMSGDPVVLIASHPTRGVDVGAQAAIWEHIKQRTAQRARGAADLRRPRRADRPLRPDRGPAARQAWSATFDPATVTPQDLGAAMTGRW